MALPADPTPPVEPTPPGAATPPAEPTPPPEPEDRKPKGDPDAAMKAHRLEQELAAEKQRAKELQEKLDAAKTAEEVQKAIDEAKAKAEADQKAAEERYAEQLKGMAAEAALVKAGCVDPKALIAAHVDMSKVEVDGESVKGLDAEGLKKSYPYLFGTTQPPTVSTGAPPAGGGASEVAGSIADGVAAALKPKG